ncbi:LysE family translocator [Kerstersia similis]|uniref:LysE family translocator n=1 Tax=Kerstersia similis TaxID=206505 RepID=UPI0039F0DBF0
MMHAPLSHDMMAPALAGSLALFMFASSITPGPNNVMLAASGLNFGFRRSVPHMLGISLGMMSMLVLVGAGMGSLFLNVPWIYEVLRYVGAAYLLYLAWRIATAGGMDDANQRGRPMTLMEALLFQWVNPKAWIMVVGAIATYVPQQNFFINLVLATLLSGLINLPCISVWALCGTALQRVLTAPLAIRCFNIGMALLLVLSLYPILATLVASSPAR